MLVWNKPQLGDREWISKCVEEAGYMGSDAAFASIYLLQSKYNIRVAFYKDCLIRYYKGITAGMDTHFRLAQEI